MAQCQADHKKHSTSRFDLYGGIFSGQLYGTNTAGNGHVDRMQSCPSFRMGQGEKFVTRESNMSSIGCSFREETGMRAGGHRKSESVSSNGFGGYGANSPTAGGGTGTGTGSLAGGLHSSPLDRRRSTGGIMAQKTPLLSPDVSPVAPSKAAGALGGAGGGGLQNGGNHGSSGNNSRNLHSSITKEHGLGTPPVHSNHRHHSGHNHSHNHSRKSSGEFLPQFVGSDHRNHVKGAVIHADGFAFGEIIKGVGNLCDDLSNSSKPNSDHETGSTGAGSGDGGSRKARSSRAESPKSIGSSSSGGSCASGGSPSVERVVNFGNILPSGGLKSTSNGNYTHNASSSPASNNNNSSTSSSNGSSLAVGGVGSISCRVAPGGGGLGGGHSNGGSGLASVPVPKTDYGSRGNRRSNSWDYATGGTHNRVSHARSGSETCSAAYTHAAANQTVGAIPRGNSLSGGSLSTSPSGSFGSSSMMENGQGGSKVLGGGGGGGGLAKGGSFGSSPAMENLMIRNALASMDAEQVKNAGNEQYKKGHFVEALNLYDKAIFLAPDKAPLRSNRAAALTGLGRLSEAMQECLQAVRLDPNYVRAHHRLATLYLRLGQIDNAAKHFRAAGSQTEWTDTQRSLGVEKHLRKCQDARKAMDWDTLLREADATIIAGADCAPQVTAYKAEALLKLHRPEEADSVMTNIRKCEELLRRPSLAPINCIVLTVQAQIDMELGRFENAVSAAEKASHIAPNDLNITVLLRKARTVSQARNLGNDLFKARKFTEAIVAYGEGLESAPKNAVLLCNRAACRSKLNQWEKAVEDSNAALEAQPNYTKALLRRAQSHAQLERWELALRDYEVLRRKLPEDPEVAKALFDVQVALKRSKGEDTYKIRRFGGDVVEVVTNDQFREAITAPGLAVVQFSTRWSERCKELAPFVAELSKRHLYITFLKVDVDDHPYLAKLENVSFVPTFKIYKNGSKMKEIAGPTQEDLERAISPFS